MRLLSLKAQSKVKRVPKADEFLLNKDAKPLNSSVKRIDNELSQG